ncbi:hypothetical protein GCM10023189_21000 [Nibrella saemangeumensis]|uniref:Uncharacterized protein n=2 Tax=Nibrella saemangeumensis TaxID=1084526 RepID=A0ABP8MQF8_9BACT
MEAAQAQRYLERSRQSYLSARSLHHTRSATQTHLQQPSALLGIQAGANLTPSTAYLPVLLVAICQVFLRQPVFLRPGSCGSLAFLRLLFEHQIAINAP